MTTQPDVISTRKRTARTARINWLIAGGLIVLSAIPFAAGVYRLISLAGGAAITPQNARFFAMPLPVIIHIVCALPYLTVGAFQFVPRFRRRNPRWHRAAGRVLTVFGAGAALSGLWMTIFYPRPPEAGDLLTVIRLVVASAMVLSVGLGFAAIRRRDVVQHRAWMTRGYALGMGAGTQVLTLMPYTLIAGQPDQFTYALLMAAGWGINLAIGEWVIYRARSKGRPEQVGGHRDRDLHKSLLPERN
jgi:uncharacterized membrane protein